MHVSTIHYEQAPIELLLLADPSEESIKKYLGRSLVFVGTVDGSVVGVALLELDGEVAELWSIAVAEAHQGKGLGRMLLQHVLAEARGRGVRRVELGTGNSSLSQLAFYQRNGFRMVGVVADYFGDYQPPVVENGIVCRDMVRLEVELD